jgi:hypothetical protein
MWTFVFTTAPRATSRAAASGLHGNHSSERLSQLMKHLGGGRCVAETLRLVACPDDSQMVPSAPRAS